MSKYAIQAASFSEAIHVGRIGRDGRSFSDKEEATDMTLFAVARYVLDHFGGGMETTFPASGLTLNVTVTQAGESDGE